MLIARYRIADGAEHYGLIEGDTLVRLAGPPFDAVSRSGRTDRLAHARLLQPVANPRVFAVGMNYKGHIAEAGAATPAKPLVFMMPTTAVVGPGEPIVIPREAQIVHHECELAVVIKRRGRRIREEEVDDFILGYTCANDVSERVIQNEEMKNGALLLGKSFDSFCPIGPAIATGLAPRSLCITTKVNGQVRQHGKVSDLLFSIPFLVSYISQAITLLPGDVILTGTPSGVGPLVAGDICEIEVAGIGRLINPVVAETP